MSDVHSIAARLKAYLKSRCLAEMGSLGRGKDGEVWKTDRLTAVKIHEQSTSYMREKDAYLRLSNRGVTHIGRFNIPKLVGFDDTFLAVEMEIVFPPFIVDFASAYLDEPPDWIEDETYTFEDFMRARFEDRTDEAMALHHELFTRTGIYLCDPHPDNIKFDDSPTSRDERF